MSPSTLIFLISGFSSQIRKLYNDNMSKGLLVFQRIEEVLNELYDAEIISYEIKDLLHDYNCTNYYAMIPFDED